jgi:hypothetical protein
VVRYIKVASNFYVINNNAFVNFNASMEGDIPFDYVEKFK